MDGNIKGPPREIRWFYGIAFRPAPGESVCGDAAVVQAFPGGLLAAVIDGLGHGREAENASRLAGEVLRTNAGVPVEQLIRLCHNGLKRTRGAVITAASIQPDRRVLIWTGVGNIEGSLLRLGSEGRPAAQETIATRGGVVGYQLPVLHSNQTPWAPGDLLLLASDGVAHGYLRSVDPAKSEKEIAEGILENFVRADDDALVLVVRGSYSRS